MIKHTLTGTMMSDDGPVSADYVDGVLLESGEQAVVSKEIPVTGKLKNLGQKTAFGPIVVGQRMIFSGSEKGGDLDTTPVESATYDGDRIIVKTRGSRYVLEVNRPKAAEKPELPTIQSLLSDFGGMIRDAFRRY